MIVYEVNLEIDTALRGDYLPWLQAHVAEMLHIEGFMSATVEEVLEPAPPPVCFALCVRYQLRDESCLHHYLTHHAAAMRRDGIKRFGNGFRAHRRILRGD